jgi:phage-related protein
MMEIFSPPVQPSTGSRRKQELKIRLAEFGDGYTQATRDGLNHNRTVLELQWDALSPADAEEILVFLARQGGTTPFWWQMPRTTDLIKWTCSEWDETFLAGRSSITATFKQSFNVG